MKIKTLLLALMGVFLLLGVVQAMPPYTYTYDTGFYPDNVDSVNITSVIEYVYQETGDNYTAIGNASNDFTLRVNYSKREFSNGAIWMVKHGHDIGIASCVPRYNITIPNDCWNADSEILSLGFQAKYGGYSQPQCFNGVIWQDIGNTINTSSNGHSGGTWHITHWYDGNWERGQLWTAGDWENVDCSSIWGGGSAIIEEAIWWRYFEEVNYFYLPNYFINNTIQATMTLTGYNLTNITNPYIKIGNTTIWNYTGGFNTSENTTDFGTTIQLNMTGTTEFEQIYLQVYGSNEGIIQLSNLNINYTPTNNVTLNFFDEENTLMSGKNVSFQFMGESSFNASTTTGVYNFESIESDQYTIVYNSDNYRQNTYVFTPAWVGDYNLNLYFVPENTSQLVLVTVEDQFGNPLQGALVKVQRYVDNAWITEQILQTDPLGRTQGAYVLNTEYYNHVIEYDGATSFGAINSDDDKMNIYVEDVSNGITFTINTLGTSDLELYQSTFGVNHSLTYVNTSNSSGYFRFFWNDATGKQWKGCLEVEKGLSLTTVCSCESYQATTSTGTVTCSVNESESSYTYYAKAYLYPEGEQTHVDSIVITIGSSGINWGTTGYIIAFLMVLIGSFVFLKSPSMSIMVGTGLFVTMGALGVVFKGMAISILLLIAVIGLLVAFLKSEGVGLMAKKLGDLAIGVIFLVFLIGGFNAFISEADQVTGLSSGAVGGGIVLLYDDVHEEEESLQTELTDEAGQASGWKPEEATSTIETRGDGGGASMLFRSGNIFTRFIKLASAQLGLHPLVIVLLTSLLGVVGFILFVRFFRGESRI